MEYALIALAALIVYQQVFWSRQVQKLVDKLMSRNYAEYVQATKPILPKVKVDDDSAIEESHFLDELNGMVSR